MAYFPLVVVNFRSLTLLEGLEVESLGRYGFHLGDNLSVSLALFFKAAGA